jgi:hypothetical protein
LDPRLKRRHKCGHLFLGLNAEIAGPAVIDLELSGDAVPCSRMFLPLRSLMKK